MTENNDEYNDQKPQNVIDCAKTNEEFHLHERMTKIEEMTNALYELLQEKSQMLDKISEILKKY
ncbi:hypothetical protein ASG89_31975 [Paenibacillus sp. Soil766]|uniref:hypothetical protein n=1 Tax=Paenibacillus sp. Soil766 TaxID=1736404 RepID=UPI00070A4BAB|nr:hypothetical protein [Paenibacillus sp. Soil766]KRE94911.1 hypothetical protein ASG89_31975 [Paenibacillus sp. Soil766]